MALVNPKRHALHWHELAQLGGAQLLVEAVVSTGGPFLDNPATVTCLAGGAWDGGIGRPSCREVALARTHGYSHETGRSDASPSCPWP